MLRCHRLLFAALVLAALQAGVLSRDALAQAHAVGPVPETPDNVSPPRDAAPQLLPAFDALGRDWAESRLERVRVEELDPLPDGPWTARGAPIDFADFADFARASGDRSVWAPPGRRAAGSAIADRPHPTLHAFAVPGLTANNISLRSAASAYQAKARQALVNALLRTPLGRTLGRVFYVRQDDPTLGPNVVGPTPWLKAFPLLSPRVNVRTRTLGLSMVWRF
jgi:hypothetical protein